MLLSGQTVPDPSSALEAANQASTQAAITLDIAYDGGTAITADNGAVAITNSAADGTNALEITKSPAGAQTGSALNITHNANASDPALKITATGVGTSKTRAGIRLQESDSPSGDQYSPAIILQSAYLDGGQSTQDWRIQAEGDAPVINYEHRLAFGTDTETWFQLQTDVNGFNVKSKRPFSVEYDDGTADSAPLGVFQVKHPVSTDGNYGRLATFETVTMTSNVTSLVVGHQWVTFRPPTLAATASKTVSSAYTVYIEGAPIQGTNVTLQNPYALYVSAGESYFGDNIRIDNSIFPSLTAVNPYLGSLTRPFDVIFLKTGGVSNTGVQFDGAAVYSPGTGDLRIVDSTGNGLKLSSGTVEVLTAGLFSPLVGGNEDTALTVNQNAFTSIVGEQATVLFDFDVGALGFSTSGNGGSITSQRAFKIDRPTYSADAPTLTITNAATLYVENAPAQGSDTIITNAYALWVDDGISRFDGDVIPGTTGSLDLGSSSLRWEAAYFDTGTFNSSGIQFDSASLYAAAAGDLRVVVSANNVAQFGSTQLKVEQGLLCDPTGATSKPTALTVNQAAFAAVTGETPAVLFALGAGTIQFDQSAVSPLASQRAVKIDQPTYSADAATLTIAEASTVYIEGAPVAGTFTNITKSYALFVDDGVARFDGGTSVVFELPPDNNDPTAGGGPATGRIPIAIGAFVRYIPYY